MSTLPHMLICLHLNNNFLLHNLVCYYILDNNILLHNYDKNQCIQLNIVQFLVLLVQYYNTKI